MTSAVSVAVLAHVDAGTVIRSTVYATEGRVTVRLGGENGRGSEVTLFVQRLELVRLLDSLTAVLVELDDQRAALTEQASSPAA